MADQARMPYTNAVIHEVQRFGDIIPLNIPRITSRDIEVQDFLIPKVGWNLLLFHHDDYQTRAGGAKITKSSS
jgi:cytochrome P450